MDIRQLQYFVEVARQKSFTKASQKLLVSQPAISKMIKSLEEEWGVTLLNRSERKIVLTDAGELAYEQAVPILQAMENLSASMNELVNAKAGKVKMGILPTVGSLLFPTIIADFKKEHPQIEIQMMQFSVKQLEVQVEAGNIDVGVTVLPVDTELFGVVPLFSEDIVVVVDKNHPLHGEASVDLSALKQESFILFTEEFALHDLVLEACLQAGFEPKVAYKSSLWDFIVEMVATQQGIALMPGSVARRSNHPSVSLVSLSSPRMHWEYALIYRKNHYLSFAAREFIRSISQTMSNRYIP